jgi:hypothetical protein
VEMVEARRAPLPKGSIAHRSQQRKRPPQLAASFISNGSGGRAAMRAVGTGPADSPRIDIYRGNSCERSFEV